VDSAAMSVGMHRSIRCKDIEIIEFCTTHPIQALAGSIIMKINIIINIGRKG
jgi:hypothetical protein